MLNTLFVPGERITSAPAAAWWRNQLWLAYLNLDGELSIRSVPVLADANASQVHLVGLDASGECSLTEWGDKLWLVFADPNGFLHLTSSTNGQTFTAPLSLGAECAWKTGLAGTASGLWLLWADNAGGAVHLWRSTNGTTFQDIGVAWAETRSSLALASDHENRRLAVMWTDRPGGQHSVSVVNLDIDDPDPFIHGNRSTVETPPSALYLSGAFTGGHGGRRLLLAAEEPLQGVSACEVQGRTIAADLSRFGGAERFSEQTYGMSLASSPSRVWAAWRAAGQDELKVAPYDVVFDLPEELRALLDTPCDPNACPPDPRLVCEAQEEFDWVPEPAAVQNAKRGDVVLTPADGVGIVGKIIGAVEPEQYYDHMGMMVEDKTMIRHSTMAHDRVQDKDYYTGSVFGRSAPTDGIRPDLLKFGWPGTITQSIDDAFYTGYNTHAPGSDSKTLNPRWDFHALNPTQSRVPRPPDGAPQEDWEAYNKTRFFCDPERPQTKHYSIHNFPNAPAYLVEKGKLLYARVVKPAPSLEAQDPEVRATLHRIADEALKIEGHYRFFAYSQAKIAEDPLYVPVASDPAWAGLPAGASWAADTMPLVCSTFIWAAVRRANAKGLPKLEFEGIVTESPDEQLASPTQDGLYRYSESERRVAAGALHAYTSERVRKQVREELMKLAAEDPAFEWGLKLSKIGVAALLALLHSPVTLVLAVLALDEEDLADLTLLFNDMPDQLANQMVNTFAFDHAAHIDSDAWENPGDGLSVSPDDIKNFWDPPGPPLNREIRHGIWGDSQKLLLTEWRYVPKRRHKLRRSSGVAIAWGRVLYEAQPLTGAEVQIGCDKDMTRVGRTDFPSYYVDVPAGRQEIVASAYWPASEWLLTGKQVVDLEPGENEVDVVLEPPPDWRRIITISGKIDLVHRVLLGSDDWVHDPVVRESRMVLASDTWGPPPPGASKLTDTPPLLLSNMAGPERVYIGFAVTLNDDLSATVEINVKHLEDFFGDDKALKTADMSDILVVESTVIRTVQPDATKTVVVDTKSGDVPPDRAHVELTISNDRAPA